MSFAHPLPWWALALVVISAGLVAWLAYSRRTLPPQRRGVLVTLRFVTLLALVVFLLRPVASGTDAGARDAVVAILVDTSRSMSIEDAGGGDRRIERARRILVDRLLPAIGSPFHVEVLGFGDGVAPVAPDALSATARRSDVAGALAGVRERYRGRAVAGVILLSDGGDTSGAGEGVAEDGPPVYAIGVGSPVAGRDREILGVTTAETILDDSRVDLAVSAVSHGLSNTPIELRLLENGRPIDVRRVTPAAEGAPVREVFQVSPGRGAPTVYTVETPVAAGELVPENNARRVLVQPPSRARRVLLVEGAPGFDHSFLKRAWAADSGLEIDSVVRKGRNEQGADTFYIQAAESRSASLAAGYPPTREALFRYDALVLANVEAHQFSRQQLEATRSFVGERGGGLLVLGARSFLRQGLAGTTLEDVLPLELSERGGGGVLPAASAAGVNRVSLTAAGEAHPVMQLAAGADDTRKRWEAVPALAAIAPVGGPRPGASVLAVTSGPGGTPRALVAVQRFGEGRSLVFTGEASWRWRMLLPATDRCVRYVLEAGAALAGAPGGRSDPAEPAARRRAGRHAAPASPGPERRVRAVGERHGRPARHLAGRARRVAPCRAGDEPGQGRTSRRTGATRTGRRLQGVGGGAPGSDPPGDGWRGSARRRSGHRDGRPPVEPGVFREARRRFRRPRPVRGSTDGSPGYPEGSRAGGRAGGAA